MQYRNIFLDKKPIGRVIFDQGMVIFQDVPEEWEDLFYQGFYLTEAEEGKETEDDLLAPDEQPEKYFKLLPLYGLEGITFSGIQEENYD